MRPAIVLALALAAIACDSKSSSPTPSVDSNTNWLATCDDGDACPDGTTCACGVCTQTCDQMTCADFRDGAVCVQGGATERLCDVVEVPEAGLCLPTCGADRPCPRGQLCLDGACQPDERRPPRCDDRFPCRGDLRCVEGRCEAPPPPRDCANQGDCGPEEICDGGRCVPAPECRREDPDACPDGTECRDGRCEALQACANDMACPPTSRCDDGVCVELGECRTAGTCPEGTRCDRGLCIRNQFCRITADCREGEFCSRGLCVRPPPCPENDALHCGQAIGGRVPAALYRCDAGMFALETTCQGPCQWIFGADDRCVDPCPAGPGTYCGDVFGERPDALLRCDATAVFAVALCPAGCVTNAPAASACAPVD